MKVLQNNAPSCPVCKTRMEHFASIPAAANLPKLLRFKCQQCGCFKTIEDPDAASSDAAKPKAA
jgi:rubredoxin